MRYLVIAALAIGFASPASAATKCDVVNEYGYYEVRESNLTDGVIYYLYANDGGGFDPVKLNLSTGGNIRFLLNDTDLGPDDKFQIRTEGGQLVSHC